MPRRLSVAPPLDADEPRRRARAAPTADWVRWLAVRVVAEGRPATEVGPLVGFSPGWVRALVHRDNAASPDALGERRRGNPGGAGLLDAGKRKELRAALARPPPGGGPWTGRLVAAWMAAALGRAVAPQRGWEQLLALGLTLQRPRPREERADPAAQAAFKKGGSPPPTR